MPIPLKPGIEIKPDSLEEYILKSALSNVLTLDTAPTTSNEILPEGRFGINSTNLYYTHQGNTYRVALTLV